MAPHEATGPLAAHKGCYEACRSSTRASAVWLLYPLDPSAKAKAMKERLFKELRGSGFSPLPLKLGRLGGDSEKA